MTTGNRMCSIKSIGFVVCVLNTLLCFGDGDIRRLAVEDVELLCRIDAGTVDTISFSSVSDTNIVSGVNFLNKLDRILRALRSKNIILSKETRLYLGCKLPLEMRQTMYRVVSEHYAQQFARGNYLISSSGRAYAHKLIGRGFFRDMNQVLWNHGYEIKAVFLEKVVIDRPVKQAFAFTDITLTRMRFPQMTRPLLANGQIDAWRSFVAEVAEWRYDDTNRVYYAGCSNCVSFLYHESARGIEQWRLKDVNLSRAVRHPFSPDRVNWVIIKGDKDERFLHWDNLYRRCAWFSGGRSDS